MERRGLMPGRAAGTAVYAAICRWLLPVLMLLLVQPATAAVREIYIMPND